MSLVRLRPEMSQLLDFRSEMQHLKLYCRGHLVFPDSLLSPPTFGQLKDAGWSKPGEEECCRCQSWPQPPILSQSITLRRPRGLS